MTTITYTSADIQACLPHRYPFLFVDRVVSFDPWKEILAYKNLTLNEPFFPGHFPGTPVMPGVLMLEAMAQAGLLLVSFSLRDYSSICPEEINPQAYQQKIGYFASADKVKFRRIVVPGDRLDLKVSLIRVGSRVFKFKALATVDNQRAGEAEIAASF
ncbi:MAG: 3-hydroxyacyl-ACP dehydratase FabZ [Deltaproteobacteria bacterium]|jgi:3-hydroxyacyl-[acyl-carrier-protein] dehydratase|nr:3-hydroxyacyl-ACP dehydratase FabZ [Deltaproteobacteria bacterium]